jgi:hypothetical protein
MTDSNTRLGLVESVKTGSGSVGHVFGCGPGDG